MKKVNKLVTIIFVFILNSYFLNLNSEMAYANTISLGVYPPISQVVIQAPARAELPFTLHNFAETPVSLDLSFKPFTASPKENGEVKYVPDVPGPNPMIFKYVTVKDQDADITTITLSPKQQKKLTLVIDIPESETPSDYYFSVLFTSKDSIQLRSEGGHSVTIGGIAMNVLLSIGPKGTPQARIEEFSAPLLLEKGPVPFTVRINNIGDQVIAPTGYILIQNMFGQTIGKVQLLKSHVLAGTTRALLDEAQNPEATASATTTYNLPPTNSPQVVWHEGFLLGPYTATLYIKASDNSPVMTSTTRFLGAPIQSIVGIVLAILMIILIKNRVTRKIRINS